jgi:hypothetical protein
MSAGAGQVITGVAFRTLIVVVAVAPCSSPRRSA